MSTFTETTRTLKSLTNNVMLTFFPILPSQTHGHRKPVATAGKIVFFLSFSFVGFYGFWYEERT